MDPSWIPCGQAQLTASLQIPFDEQVIPEDERIPRFTSATWKYDSGAIGHLEHGVALQGTEWVCPYPRIVLADSPRFSTELAVFGDGYQLKLVDPCEYLKAEECLS